MLSFKLLKKSNKSLARHGVIKTSHGLVETPAIVPVATQAVIKTLDSQDVLQSKTQLLINNTYHLHLRPGEKQVARVGGLHKFMSWPKTLMTDSGGYQVFSLGFGHDLSIGKVSKKTDQAKGVSLGKQPQRLKITPAGVIFRSHIDGRELFIGPRESIKIQEQLGADIILAFDECPPPVADYEYVKKSVELTHVWAKTCLKTHSTKQALYGIVQGGKYKDLRIKSAEFIGNLGFDGFAIGGEFGEAKTDMAKMLQWVVNYLPEIKPRHLLGIGHPEDIPILIKAGIDTFDCIVPTHYARHGVAFTTSGRLDAAKMIYSKDLKPLDKKCHCYVCQQYTRSYICHLLRAKEITGLKLLTMHNLYFYNSLVESYRKLIKQGKI